MPNDPAESVRSGQNLLKRAMAAFVHRGLRDKFGQRWWKNGVEPYLNNPSLHMPADVLREMRNPLNSAEDKFQMLDMYALLFIMEQEWDDVFRIVLNEDAVEYISELKRIRNRIAHEKSFSLVDAKRDIVTMRQFAQLIAAPEEKELIKLENRVQRRIEKEDNIDRFKTDRSVIGNSPRSLTEIYVRQKLGNLKGKHVTIKSGDEFHIYEVNDWQVKYDPAQTSAPGFYWSYISSIVKLIYKIQEAGLVPNSAADIGDIYENLGISADEGLTTDYMYGILRVLGIINNDDKAGKVLECKNRSCPRYPH